MDSSDHTRQTAKALNFWRVLSSDPAVRAHQQGLVVEDMTTKMLAGEKAPEAPQYWSSGGASLGTQLRAGFMSLLITVLLGFLAFLWLWNSLSSAGAGARSTADVPRPTAVETAVPRSIPAEPAVESNPVAPQQNVPAAPVAEIPQLSAQTCEAVLTVLKTSDDTELLLANAELAKQCIALRHLKELTVRSIVSNRGNVSLLRVFLKPS